MAQSASAKRILALFFLLCPVNIIGTWWRVAASPLLMYSNRICREARRASGRAGTLCQREPQVVRAVVAGARLGLRECRHQFARRRWDCSVPRKYFGRILQQDIREAAFVNAITSAGVTFAVTKACSLGELPQCGCEDPRGRLRPNGFPHPPVAGDTHVVAEAGVQRAAVQDVWEWGGCGDDVAFGFKKSRIYLDRRRWRGAGDLKTLIDLHNNEAGRLVVRDHMRVECKCHGLSGSCAMRTCWKKMPPFRKVGDHLKLCFDGAFKVSASNDGRTLAPVGHNIKPYGRYDLLYSAESPDFCLENRRLGSLGTRGRACNATSPGTGGCQLLCCARGARSEVTVVRETCQCRFQWCCKVHCNQCVVRRESSVCL
uniref:protein Wnt-6-like isoform X2 n=1 Tax=Myxine glutinosa TaxID=7769 RepID=UPI00358FBA20